MVGLIPAAGLDECAQRPCILGVRHNFKYNDWLKL